MKDTNFGKPLSRLIIMVAICMLSLHAMAYDFSYTYQGKTLYYNITSDNTVEVTYYSSDNYFQNNNYVNGDVVIPSSVTNNSTTYSVTSIGEGAFSYCSGLISVTIPNSVTSIGEAAFYGCSGLTSVTIPNSVTSIGEAAFYGCSGLTSVTIPNSVTSIDYAAFRDCSSLTSVPIPENVTSIGESAFRDCSSLTSVTIPNNVSSIGGFAFNGCSSLITLNFNAINCNDFAPNSNSPFSSCPISTINIGEGVERIPAYFAYKSNSLTSVTIPNSVTSIGDHAFRACSSLASVNIGNGVISIGNEVFRACSSLASVTIGSSVASIGNYAFGFCNTLTSIVSKATIPPALGNEVFPNPNSCNVIVPCGSLETYTSSQWNDYFPSRIEQDCSVSLQEVESTREFVVYPNPIRGFATVEFEALQEHGLLRIADLGGRVVKTFDLAAGTESVRLDLRDLPSGVYTLMIGNTTKKLIVE